MAGAAEHPKATRVSKPLPKERLQALENGLAKAKTLRLCTRRDNGLFRDNSTLATWAHPAVYGDKLPAELVDKARKSLEAAKDAK